ncbi:hypothetical protein TanjilG_18682 [Lupinus angustifolius]|uniref:Uncharacterized protein n=1 Tax=Lupinus angustifolius TaxID=3871 RepID=A0A1J7HA70_LUPAN|nr:hypothetical protein TanjilG_18682 [Lupinus angustifolius]
MMMAPPGGEGGSETSSSQCPVLDLNLPPGGRDEDTSMNHPSLNPSHPKPEVYHPLHDDKTLTIERAIEMALLTDGFSRDELGDPRKRDEIRGLFLYAKGEILSYRKSREMQEELEYGTHQSKAYRDIIDAISSSKLFLRRVKGIKRWDKGDIL